jgi:hypothetical protein
VKEKSDTEVVPPPVIPVTPVTPVTPPADSVQAIRYFPNPVSDVLHIQNLNPVDEWNLLKVVSVHGDMVKSLELHGQKDIDLNIANLSSGLYVVVLESDVTQPVRLKFVKL